MLFCVTKLTQFDSTTALDGLINLSGAEWVVRQEELSDVSDKPVAKKLCTQILL